MNRPAPEKYAPLKHYVSKHGGLRLNAFGAQSRFRDQIVDWAIEEWPLESPPDRIEEVLRARLSIRVRQEYGSVLAAFLIPVIVNVIVRLIIEWWSPHTRRHIVRDWAADAKEAKG